MPSPDRCPRCDRAECPTLAPQSEQVTRAFSRSHVGPGETWLHPDAVHRGRCTEEDRQILNAEYTARRERAQDCLRHEVDWRAEALALRARLADLGAAQDRLRSALADLTNIHIFIRDALGAGGTEEGLDAAKRVVRERDEARARLASPPSLAPLRARAEALLAVADRSTPGPWTTNKVEHRGGEDGDGEVELEEWYLVAPGQSPPVTVASCCDLSGDTDERNARAIAALRDAPALIRDLLAALTGKDGAA